MSKLSVSATLYRLGEIKSLIHDDDINLANIKIEEFIKAITCSKHICERCGCHLSEEKFQMAGEYCEPCWMEINA